MRSTDVHSHIFNVHTQLMQYNEKNNTIVFEFNTVTAITIGSPFRRGWYTFYKRINNVIHWFVKVRS